MIEAGVVVGCWSDLDYIAKTKHKLDIMQIPRPLFKLPMYVLGCELEAIAIPSGAGGYTLEQSSRLTRAGLCESLPPVQSRDNRLK